MSEKSNPEENDLSNLFLDDSDDKMILIIINLNLLMKKLNLKILINQN